MNLISSINKWSSQVFYLDLRSLSLFRIFLGLTLIADLCYRLLDYDAFYTNTGVFPAYLLDYYIIPSLYKWIFHQFPTWPKLLFYFHILFAFLFTIGLKTRFFQFCSWLLLILLQYRNPALIGGPDAYLRILFFWSFFIPLNRYWSLDQKSEKLLNSSTQPARFSQAYFILQIMLIYILSGLMKNHSFWIKEGTALLHIFNQNRYATHLATQLTQYPLLLKIMSHTIPPLEVLLPIILLSSKKNSIMRYSFISIGLVFHWIILYPLLNLSIFPLVATCGFMAFLPSAFWNCFKIKNHYPSFKDKILSSQHKIFIPLFLSICFILVIIQNVEQFTNSPILSMKIRQEVTFTLGLNQDWGLFATQNGNEKTWLDDGWFVGKLRFRKIGDKDIQTMDFLSGKLKKINWYSPKNYQKTLPSRRWVSFMERFLARQYPIFNQAFGNYICHNWNKDGIIPLDVHIHYMKELDSSLGLDSPIKNIFLFKYSCQDPNSNY